MTVITVFSTTASFLSFALGRETGSKPKLEDFAWGPRIAATPTGKTTNPGHGYAPHIGVEREYTYVRISTNYLILGVEKERFRAAYVAFPGLDNFDKITNCLLGCYGEPDKSNSAPDNRSWSGDDLNVRLLYQVDTKEGILTLTYQGA